MGKRKREEASALRKMFGIGEASTNKLWAHSVRPLPLFISLFKSSFLTTYILYYTHREGLGEIKYPHDSSTYLVCLILRELIKIIICCSFKTL